MDEYDLERLRASQSGKASQTERAHVSFLADVRSRSGTSSCMVGSIKGLISDAQSGARSEEEAFEVLGANVPCTTLDHLSPPVRDVPLNSRCTGMRITRTQREGYYQAYACSVGMSVPQVVLGCDQEETEEEVSTDKKKCCARELGEGSELVRDEGVGTACSGRTSSTEAFIAVPGSEENSKSGKLGTGLSTGQGTGPSTGLGTGQKDTHADKDRQSTSQNYPDTRPEKRTLADAPQEQINKWFATTGVKLGPLSEQEHDMITRLLYTYQDLNSTELKDLPATPLYTHRVRLKEGTLPFNRAKQRRWPPGKEFWMKRIINEGLKYGLYERTIQANGKLSDWNAQAQLVDKSDDPGEWDEPRLTFNYQNVVEDKPGCFVELMSTCHDYMGHPSHRMFHKLDLKHGYWAIVVHVDDRHYFAFSIPGLGQLQPTRMPQGSCSSGFSFTELMYITLGQIPNSPTMPGRASVLVPEAEHGLQKVAFYIDDMFSGMETFEQGYAVLADEIFPRLDWAKLRLSFKKLELFVTEVVALGITHKAGGILVTKAERCDKIRSFPVPRDVTGVRRFLGVVGITRNCVKNFAELKVPLSRLTGDVEFEWGAREQVAFQIIRDKCAERVEMHGWNFLEPVRLYSDASMNGAGCLITQMRPSGRAGKLIEVPIAYDAFTFSKSQKNYGMYKKELCAIVEFCRKYEHMLRSPKMSLVLTDHKPLVFFLKSAVLDGIYSRWASELRCLNLDIEWIPGPKNVVADSLSRTIFPDAECGTPPLEEFGELVVDDNGDPLWVWKDGKGGYEELLKKIGEPLREAELNKLFLSPEPESTLPEGTKFAAQIASLESRFPDQIVDALLASVLVCSDRRHGWDLVANLGEQGQPIKPPALPHTRYIRSDWYKDVAVFIADGTVPEQCHTKVQKAAFLRKAARYTVVPGGDMYQEIKGVEKRCMTQEEVAQTLLEAHDHGGHFGWTITLRKLREYYWPGMSQDVRDYILGCLVCAKHGTAVRSQTQARVTVEKPMELLGIDFIGPFPKFGGVGEYWILIAIDYFTRYIWAEATERNYSDTVIRFLLSIWNRFGVSIGAYMDPGSHFGSRVKDFAEARGVLWINSPVAAKKAVGMIEKAVDILQRVLKKIIPEPSKWSEYVTLATFEVNKREIAHLLYSPDEIMLGYDPPSALEIKFPGSHRQSLSAALAADKEDALPEDEVHSDLVLGFMLRRQMIRREAGERSEYYKDKAAQRHDLGIRGEQNYVPGDLVMLYDHREAGKKLRPVWRGPFIITGPGGDMGKSYTLRQIDGTPIPRYYYGDALKHFKLREGRLITHYEEALPVLQNIRTGRAAFRLPKDLRTVPGVSSST